MIRDEYTCERMNDEKLAKTMRGNEPPSHSKGMRRDIVYHNNHVRDANWMGSEAAGSHKPRCRGWECEKSPS